MNTTPNLGLKKPAQEDFYNVDDFNYNADKLDEEVARRIINDGGVPSIQAGLDASKPAPGTTGRLYVATDTQIIYRDTGTAWQKVGAVKWDDIDGKPDLALASDLTTHSADVLHVPYAVATGSANAYSVTISGITSYKEGLAIAVKINTDNTGASTINVNGLGAKSIKKPNGGDVVAGNLKANSIYTLRYNGTNFILQGEGGGGTAQPAHVLSGYTFTNDQGEQTGAMPNNGAVVITPGTSNITIPAGYHNGSGYVKGDANLIAANIKKGVSIFGITGTHVYTAQPGNTILLSSDSQNTIGFKNKWAKYKEIQVYFDGIVRVSFDMKAMGSSNTLVKGQIYINDIPVGTLRETSNYTTFTTYTEDISINVNDKIQLYGYNAPSFRNFRVQVSSLGTTASYYD